MPVTETVKTRLMKQLHGRLCAPPYAGAATLWLAVSGGMDSMVMLDVFRRMGHVHKSELRVVHFHHGTGAFADQSQALVNRYCDQYRIPLSSYNYTHEGGNFEYEASSFRHATLKRLCRTDHCYLLGHHRGDQAETCLQTLVRGAGITTPLGMAARNGRCLRPLLRVDRTLIAEHARRAAVPHLLDPTNFTGNHFRNVVRHEVLPVLRSCHGNAESRMGAFIEDLTSLREALNLEAGAVFEQAFQADGQLLPREVFAGTKPYLWDFVLAHFWRRLGLSKPIRAHNDQIKSWLEQGEEGHFAHLSGRFWCDRDGLTWEKPPAIEPTHGHFGQPVDWGSWKLLLLEKEATAPGFTLCPKQTLSSAEREKLRTNRVPLRVRANLPIIRIGNQEHTFNEVINNRSGANITIEVISPPNLGVFFRDKGRRAS